MRRYARDEIRRRFLDTNAKGEPIVVCGCGCGFTAKCADEAGADMIGLYSSSFARMEYCGWTDFFALSDNNQLQVYNATILEENGEHICKVSRI